MEKSDTKMIVNLSEIPLDGSLGLLAYGDVAFVAWRKIKKDKRNDETNR
ncbi:MAG: hypothetical protein KDD20_13020 [Mangrovimonas sp.]|nr:hypothetical protein [Mangrovimonas sp.]MCB0427107.1 hypothetical protein [Mangrovimonas sp.]MCB0439654.1 hypothetical protein [Mangrovimonas sp.]